MAAKFDLFSSADGQYYFNLKAGNGKIILTSERYTTKASAKGGIEAVRANSLVERRFDCRRSRRDEPYFVLKAANGEPIGTSEMYSSTSAMNNGIASVATNGPAARIDDRSSRGLTAPA